MKIAIKPELKKRLDGLKSKYEKVSKFADLLPIFSKSIVDNEFTGEQYCRLGDRYGKLYFAWGINWLSKENGFINVYVNTYSLFGDECSDFAHQELEKTIKNIKVHFYDALNSTFYFLPSEYEEGLAKLETWFIETKSKTESYLKQKKKAELERQLMELSND